MLHRLYTMDYGSRRSGSKAADVTDEYHPLFFLDYISIIGLPLRPLTRANDRFFDNVTVTFKDWQMPYPGNHEGGIWGEGQDEIRDLRYVFYPRLLKSNATFIPITV